MKQTLSEREKALFNLLENWQPPVMSPDLNDRILERLNRESKTNTFNIWWKVAATFLILINLSIAIKEIVNSKANNESSYISYLESDMQSINNEYTGLE